MRKQNTPDPESDDSPVSVSMHYQHAGRDGIIQRGSARLVARNRHSVRETVHSHLRDENLQPDTVVYAYD